LSVRSPDLTPTSGPHPFKMVFGNVFWPESNPTASPRVVLSRRADRAESQCPGQAPRGHHRRRRSTSFEASFQSQRGASSSLNGRRQVPFAGHTRRAPHFSNNILTSVITLNSNATIRVWTPAARSRCLSRHHHGLPINNPYTLTKDLPAAGFSKTPTAISATLSSTRRPDGRTAGPLAPSATPHGPGRCPISASNADERAPGRWRTNRSDRQSDPLNLFRPSVINGSGCAGKMSPATIPGRAPLPWPAIRTSLPYSPCWQLVFFGSSPW